MRRRGLAAGGKEHGAGERTPFDQLQVQRLKKRKLQLKDMITKLEDLLYPDIIA